MIAGYANVALVMPRANLKNGTLSLFVAARGSIYINIFMPVYLQLELEVSESSVRMGHWHKVVHKIPIPFQTPRSKRETGSFRKFQDFKLDSDTEQSHRAASRPAVVHHRDRANFSLSRHTFVRVPAGARLDTLLTFR